MLLSLLACVAAPFFTALPMQRRIRFAVLGALGFIASAVISILASLVAFGVPIDWHMSMDLLTRAVEGMAASAAVWKNREPFATTIAHFFH
jgi:hypothetical protein